MYLVENLAASRHKCSRGKQVNTYANLEVSFNMNTRNAACMKKKNRSILKVDMSVQ